MEALNLAAIAAARHTIYLENQYLAARRIVDALTARLREDDGPEIVIVVPRRGKNPLERGTMDGARHRLIQVLWAADDHHRLGVYWPVNEAGTPIYVHSKVMVIDDRLLRIGSSNLNNRSMGFDSECDVAIEAEPTGSEHDELRIQITSVRDQLVSEHLGVSVDEFATAVQEHRSLLRGHRGTSRRGQKSAAGYRAHRVGRGEPASGERSHGSRPCPQVTDPKCAAVHSGTQRLTQRLAGSAGGGWGYRVTMHRPDTIIEIHRERVQDQTVEIFGGDKYTESVDGTGYSATATLDLTLDRVWFILDSQQRLWQEEADGESR